MSTSKVNDWKFEVDFNLRYNRWFLTPLGLWLPKKNYEKCLSQFFILFTIFVLVIFLVPHGLYILLMVSNPAEQLRMCGPLSYAIMATGKYIFVLKNTRGIATCIKMIEDDWKAYVNKSKEKQLMLEAGRWVENFTKISLVFMIGGTLARNVIIPMIKMVKNLSTPNATLGLVFPSYFGIKSFHFSTSADLVFLALFFTHSISFIYMSIINGGLCVLAAKFIMHTCSQIEIMKMHLEVTSNSINDESSSVVNYQANFKSIIVKHLQILRFISNIEKTLTGAFFCEFGGSTFGICMLGYYIITAIERKNAQAALTYTFILLLYVSNMFIYCYLGNRLTEQCQEVGEKAYEINWTELDVQKYGISGVQMIILVSQHPPKLSAGKVIFLTMETFSAVMRVAATYFNMLRKFTTDI